VEHSVSILPATSLQFQDASQQFPFHFSTGLRPFLSSALHCFSWTYCFLVTARLSRYTSVYSIVVRYCSNSSRHRYRKMMMKMSQKTPPRNFLSNSVQCELILAIFLHKILRKSDVSNFAFVRLTCKMSLACICHAVINEYWLIDWLYLENLESDFSAISCPRYSQLQLDKFS